jgi:hypothetical protein
MDIKCQAQHTLRCAQAKSHEHAKPMDNGTEQFHFTLRVCSGVRILMVAQANPSMPMDSISITPVKVAPPPSALPAE